MKIVITGSKGYIGKLVTEAVRSKFVSHDIQEIDLQIGSDIYDVEGLEADVLIHLAAFTSVVESYERYEDYIVNNVTKYIKFLRNNKFGRVIYASSCSVMPTRDNINPDSTYAMTKLVCEYISQWHTSNVVSLRFGNPTGLSNELHGVEDYRTMCMGEPNVMAKLANALVKDEEFTVHNNPKMVRDFFPVFWIAEVISNLVESSVTGTYYLGSGIETDVMSLLQDIIQEHGIKYSFIEPPPGVSEGFAPDVQLEIMQYISEFDSYAPEKFVKEQFYHYINLCKRAQ